MKPIIFARVTDMLYYKGITKKDKPFNGGAYVKDTGLAHECYNFSAMTFEGDEQEYCLGFAQLPGTSKNKPIELHIEKMPGCKLLKKEAVVEDAIVVFCSKAFNSQTMRVVGFYKNATVFRQQQECVFENGDYQYFNFIAKKEDCVLLPNHERHSKSKWYVPSSGKRNSSFGFGRSNICFLGASDNPDEVAFVNHMIESIETYNGENWINKGEE